MHGDRDNDAIGRFAEKANLLRHDPPAVDHDPLANPLELLRRRPGPGQDVIFLRQPVPRMHHPVGNIAVVAEQQQSLGVAIEAANRIDALGDVDQIHHSPTPPFVADGGDVAGRLVQDHVSKWLGPENLVVDSDLIATGVGSGAEFGHDLPVDLDPAFANQVFGCPARGYPARSEDTLEPFQSGFSRCVRRDQRKMSGRSAITSGPAKNSTRPASLSVGPSGSNSSW
jgi:hypothetical protein